MSSVEYLAKHPLLLLYLKGIERLFPKSQKVPLQPPKKILLSNLAHLGDVVVTTALLPPLKRLYPETKIGFLIGSWSKDVLEDHPLIDRCHFVDHWRLDRSSKPLFYKMAAYMRSGRRAIREIEKEQYDWAVDLYPYFPNAAPLLWRAHIPVRIGYSSGGFGPLFTHPHLWKQKKQSILRYQCELFGIDEKVSPSLIAEPIPLPKNYMVVHMGTGAPSKEWPHAHWKRVVEYFAQKNYPLLFTGRGEKENRRIERMIHETGYGENYCNRLDWKQFVFLVQHARFIVSVDTAIAHIATSSETAHLMISPNIDWLWKPDNPNCKTVSIKEPVEIILNHIRKEMENDPVACE